MPSSRPLRYIGLMSGTSVDAVDAALIEIKNSKVHLLHFSETPVPKALQKKLIKLNQTKQIDLNSLCLLQKQLADLFSSAVANLLEGANLTAAEITAIGSHGQTIFHAPEIPMTLQIGHPAFIAKQTGITTVADFRVDDMALGGQGAPFAPVFHQQLFAQQQACVVVNIGGIANISYLPAQQSDAQIQGWDTGPGNGIIDDLCQKHLQKEYDKNGAIAKRGHINPPLLNALLQHPYFTQAAPKSTGRDIFNLPWLEQLITHNHFKISAEDLIATATELTAITIANQIKTIAQNREAIWIVGGGAHNPFLLERLQSHLAEHTVASSSMQKIDPNAVEAMMMAWLAHQRLENKNVKLASVTGAKRNAVLGGVWQP